MGPWQFWHLYCGKFSYLHFPHRLFDLSNECTVVALYKVISSLNTTFLTLPRVTYQGIYISKATTIMLKSCKTVEVMCMKELEDIRAEKLESYWNDMKPPSVTLETKMPKWPIFSCTR